MPPITFHELPERFLDQHHASPQTIGFIRSRLQRPLAAFETVRAGDITPESWQRFLASLPAGEVGKAYRHDIARSVKQVYRWGVEAGLVARNPAARLKAPAPVRSENIIAFESGMRLRP